MLVNHDVVHMHAEDAAAVWLRRDEAVYRNDRTHKERVRLDLRVEAHLHGLQFAGDAGWKLALELLERYRGPGEVFAAGVLALGSEQSARLDRVLPFASEPDGMRALISAAGWLPFEALVPRLGGWLGSNDPRARALAVGAHAVNRRDPGATLRECLQCEDAQLLGRTLQAAAELGRTDLLEACRAHLQTPGVRDHAALAAARLGARDEAVARGLRGATTHPTLWRDAVAELVETQRDDADVQLRAWTQNQKAELVIAGIEALGDTQHIPQLIRWMDDRSLARAAGDAFSTLTGLDLAFHDLDQDPPADYTSGPNDDPDDPRVALDPEDHLAWPARFAVASRWQREQAQFEPGVRYLAGKAVGWCSGAEATDTHRAHLRELAQQGRPRQRLDAARMLGAQDPTRPRIEARAFEGSKRALPGLDQWGAARPRNAAKHASA